MRTTTSKFGMSARVGHDSSAFYHSKRYQATSVDSRKYLAREKIVPQKIRNKIFHKSSEKMTELPDNSVHLMGTSPPYNVGKEYDNNLTMDEYRISDLPNGNGLCL